MKCQIPTTGPHTWYIHFKSCWNHFLLVCQISRRKTSIRWPLYTEQWFSALSVLKILMPRAQMQYQYSALEIPVPGLSLLPQGILMLWVESKPSPTALELSQSSSNDSRAESKLTCDRKQWFSSLGLFRGPFWCQFSEHPLLHTHDRSRIYSKNIYTHMDAVIVWPTKSPSL